MKVMYLRTALFPYLLVILVLCGCGGVMRTGDFTTFLVGQIQAYGGAVSLTNRLPTINAKWKFSKDSGGFECVVYGSDFQNVDALATQIFGSAGEAATDPNVPYRLFRASSVGVALVISQTSDGVKINCLRGITVGHPKR